MTFCYIDPQTLFQILRMGELVSFCLCLPVPILNSFYLCVGSYRPQVYKMKHVAMGSAFTKICERTVCSKELLKLSTA